jgi:hypothetical protein
MTPIYEIKLISDIDKRDVFDFYKEHGTAAQSKIEHKITDSFGDLAISGTVAIDPASSKIVGAYLAKPQSLSCSPSSIVYQSMDTLVSQNARGHSLTVKMAEALYKELSTRDVGIVMGIPNKLIEPLRLNRLKWSNVRQIYRHTLIIPRAIQYFIPKKYTVTELVSAAQVQDECSLNSHQLIDVCSANPRLKMLSVSDTTIVCFINNNRVEVGAIRYSKNIQLLGRIFTLSAVMKYLGVKILISYCTNSTATNKFFKMVPHLKTKSLKLSGRILKDDAEVDFKNLEIEYFEFDTYGHGC